MGNFLGAGLFCILVREEYTFIIIYQIIHLRFTVCKLYLNSSKLKKKSLLLGCKKEGNLTLCNCMMDLEITLLSEISQSEKHNCHVISVICEIE